MFYREPRPLDARVHADRSLAPNRTFGFAADTNCVPLLFSEFIRACRQYPIVFTAAPATQPLALLGIRTGQNLFVDHEGRWAEEFHIPAYVRRYPFIFMESPDQQQFTLCIDTAAGSVVQNNDNPLFKDGKPTELTQQALTFCRAFHGEHMVTTEFAKAVNDAELLVDKTAEVTLKNGQKLSLTGFRVIDEEKFNNLPDETFLNWRKRGWLPLVYAHLTSTANWSTLINRAAATLDS